MLLEVDAQTLSKVLKIANKIAPAKAVNSTSQVKLEATQPKDGESAKLWVTVTNYDLSFVAPVEASISKPGIALVNCAMFSRLISSFEGPTTLKMDKSHLNVSCGRSKHKLGSAAAENFPAVTKEDSESCVVIPTETFSGLLKRTFYATKYTSDKPVLAGVLIVTDESKAQFVASDSLLLASAQAPLENNRVKFYDTLPKTAAALVDSMTIASEATEMRFFSDSNRFHLYFGDYYLSASLISQKYPDVRGMFKDEEAVQVSIPTPSLKSVLARTLLMSDKVSHAATVEFSKDTATLTSTDSENEAIEQTDVNSNKDFSMTFVLNYLSDFLALLPLCTEIRVSAEDKLNRFQVAAVGDAYSAKISIPTMRN